MVRRKQKEQIIIDSIRNVARSAVPVGGRVVLFGSRARGDYRADSDWDLLIILNKARIDQTDYDNVSYPFFENGLRLGQSFSPILYTADEWDSRKTTLFRYNVEKDGIQIL